MLRRVTEHTDFSWEGVMPGRSKSSALTLVSIALIAMLARPAGATFTPGTTQTLSTTAGPGSVAVGDVDNDGIPDMVVPGVGGSGISFLRGLGGGAFAPKVVTPSNQVGQLVLADFNFDGKLDI